MTHPEANSQASGRRRVAWRILPFVFLLYVVCYVDRANLAFANLRMSADLGFSDRAYGLGSGIFFAGYILLEIPGAVIVERWSARKWIARIMLSWGAVTVLTAFIHTPAQFYLVRFLLGLAEASFFPGVIVYLTHWFRAADRAKAIGFFYAAVPAATIVGSLLAGWLLRVQWLGVAGWRWIFIVEGVLPILLGVVTLFHLTDHPREASWLSETERQWIEREIQEEVSAKRRGLGDSIERAFTDKKVLFLIVPYFLAQVGAQASVFWVPTFFKRLSGLSASEVAWWITVPAAAGIVAMIANAWHSDKTRERRWHASIPLLLAGVAYLAIPEAKGFGVVMMLLIVGGCMVAYYPVFWSMPTFLLSESAAAASFGFINSMGHTGGFFGPSAVGVLNSTTGRLDGSFWLIGGCFVAAGVLVTIVRIESSEQNL